MIATATDLLSEIMDSWHRTCATVGRGDARAKRGAAPNTQAPLSSNYPKRRGPEEHYVKYSEPFEVAMHLLRSVLLRLGSVLFVFCGTSLLILFHERGPLRFYLLACGMPARKSLLFCELSDRDFDHCGAR
jgi:hypothetical protein